MNVLQKVLLSAGTATAAIILSDILKRSFIIKDAKKQIGSNYCWGGTTPGSFDCSGYIQYILNQRGINLPRTVAEIYKAVPKSTNPKPGNLIFFGTGTNPTHIGMILPNGQFIHSGSSTGVTISNYRSNPYWNDRLIGFGKLPSTILV